MTTRISTCTRPIGPHGEPCGAVIRPSYVETTGTILGEPRKPAGEIVHPAKCERCAATYPDMVSIPLTSADLQLIGQRLAESTRQRLESLATASERTPGCYEVPITEHEARDLASKAANLGLIPLASKIRHEVNGLTVARRGR